MKNHLLVLVILCSAITATAQKPRVFFDAYCNGSLGNWGKGNILKGWDSNNQLYYDTSIVDNNTSITDTFAYHQLLKKMPEDKAAYVYYYSQQEHWPAGLLHFINNHTPGQIDTFLNEHAVTYYFTKYEQFDYNGAKGYFQNYSNTKRPRMITTHLLELPAAENSGLPDSMRPAMDIYLPLNCYPILNKGEWDKLGISGEKKIDKALKKMEAFIAGNNEKVDVSLYFKTTTPVPPVTDEVLLQNHQRYVAFLKEVYSNYITDITAKKKKSIDEVKESLQFYKDLLNKVIDNYRDNCEWLMKAYNNKEYDKILLFSKWKVSFKFTGSSSSGINGPHLYANADHTLQFENINNNLRMKSHVVTSGAYEYKAENKMDNVFQDFDIWGDFKFAAGTFTPLPGQYTASFTHYNATPFDQLPQFFLRKKVNGLLDADFTFVINTSGIYDYPVPQLILNGERFPLLWTYEKEVSDNTDLLNAEIDKIKLRLASMQ